MVFKSETEFEVFVRNSIRKRILSENIEDLICLESKSITDITILREGPNPGIFFIEAKLFNPSNGRIGLGNGNGSGIQSELLQKRPSYIEKNMRWIIARTDQKGCLFLNNNDIVLNVPNGVKLGKQNNIRPRVFETFEIFDEYQLIDEIFYWLKT